MMMMMIVVVINLSRQYPDLSLHPPVAHSSLKMMDDEDYSDNDDDVTRW